MTDSARPPQQPAPRDPWFRRHPVMALVVAAVFAVAVFVLTVFAGRPGDDYFLLYMFPVALIAVTFGVRAGAAAGVTAVAFVVAWAVLRDVSLPTSGWVSCGVAMPALGVVQGRASDRLRPAEVERRQLEAGALLHHEAIEINDSLVQGMTPARWSLQAGSGRHRPRDPRRDPWRGHELVSDLIRRAGMGGRSEPLRKR